MMSRSRGTLIDHLTELRRRLMWCVGIFLAFFCFFYLFSTEIFGYLARPLLNFTSDRHHHLIYTALPEAFMTYVRVGCFAALLFSFPFFVYQAWAFVAPGLYRQERKIVGLFFMWSPLLFYAGIAMAFLGVFPLAMKFFLSFESTSPGFSLHLEAKVNEYLSFLISLMVGFGLAFQLPVIIVLLNRFGILPVAMLIDYRRYAILGITILAALCTPPDAMSMIALAIPLTLLYELAIIVIRWVDKNSPPKHK